MERSNITVGMKVTVSGGKYHGVWEVTKINPKNIRLAQGTTRLNAHPSFLSPAPEGAASGVTEFVLPKHLAEGTVVKSRSSKVKGLYVVTKNNPTTTTIMPLGGGSAGWRVSAESLTEVPLSDLAAALTYQ